MSYVHEKYLSISCDMDFLIEGEALYCAYFLPLYATIGIRTWTGNCLSHKN